MNEAAVQLTGIESPVGKVFNFQGVSYPVIGVVKDYHFETLNSEISPLVLFYFKKDLSYLFVKIKSEDVARTLSYLRSTWDNFEPDYPFEYHFFDDDFDNLYKTEIRLGNNFKYFSGLALFISCLGLFGLASFMTAQRKKEIGIRKVFGASLFRIITMLSSESIKWVVISNIIAWPVGYFLMKTWLQSYAYRTSIDIAFFIIAGALTFFIALSTVSYHTLKSGLADPVDSIRYE